MLNHTITKNDKGFTLSFSITDEDGDAVDLADYTVNLQAWSIYAPSTNVVSGTCTKGDDPTDGSCTYTVLEADAATAGTYQGRLYLTKAGVIQTVYDFFFTVPGGGYCSLAQVKSEMQNFGSVPIDDYDASLQSMIETCKDYIDDYCRRTFYPVVEETAKYYDGVSEILFIDDLLSVDSFKLDTDGDGVFETTLTANTDYILYPQNKTPKTYVELSTHSSRSISSFANGIKRGVEITGDWGYSLTIPKVVNRASVIQVIRWYQRMMGGYSTIIGTPEVGTVPVYQGLDSSIKSMLNPLIKGIA